MRRAQSEYAEKKGMGAGVQSVTIIEHPATHTFHLNGTPATDNTKGVAIE